MTTTHVFVVDFNTFKYHLEYMFAGTGSKDNRVDFNNSPNSSLHYATENNLVGMVADANRIRKDDNIIFYLQQDKSEGIQEGKFYGLFRAVHDWSFLDKNDDSQYLRKELGKSLTFRTLIAPKEVYPEGVTEWEALDSIKNIENPNQMLWSLIYRKLRGNRGNTMITEYEASRLISMIKKKNESTTMDGEAFTFNSKEERIEGVQTNMKYHGRIEEIEIFPRLKSRYETGHAFEAHLQAYITKNIGKGTNRMLDDIILNNSQIEWIGNEVYCGVGMQRIDFMVKLSAENGNIIIVPVELKATNATKDAVTQMNRYLDWLKQYYIPNLATQNISIRPVIMGMKYTSTNELSRKELLRSIRQQIIGGISIEYAEYSIVDDQLLFDKVNVQ